MSSEAVAVYLPTLDKLRAVAPLFKLDLLPTKPDEMEPLAVLVVQAALVRRTSWTEDVLNVPDYVQRGEPPAPVDDQPRHHVRIDERLGGGICLSCTERRGYRKCRVCGGRGRIMNDNYLCSCTAGWISCANCRGTGETDRVRLRYYSDTPAYLNEAYMPRHIAQNPSLFRLETFMEEGLNILRSLPDELRCHDLTGEVTGTAYRGGKKVVRPHFHGHDFGDTIDQALAGLSAAGAGANVARYQVRAFAWPFLRLRWSGYPSLVTYIDRQHQVRLFQGTTTDDE